MSELIEKLNVKEVNFARREGNLNAEERTIYTEELSQLRSHGICTRLCN